MQSVWKDTFWITKFFHATQGNQKNFPKEQKYFFHREMWAGSTAEFSDHAKQFHSQ